MSSRKIVLIKKFVEFQNETKNLLQENSIFPSIEDFDLVDLLVLFDMNFSSCKTDEEYSEVIKTLIKFNDIKINEDDKKELIKISINFINWLKEFNKK